MRISQKNVYSDLKSDHPFQTSIFGKNEMFGKLRIFDFIIKNKELDNFEITRTKKILLYQNWPKCLKNNV